jgi:hypothetical protein
MYTFQALQLADPHLHLRCKQQQAHQSCVRRGICKIHPAVAARDGAQPTVMCDPEYICLPLLDTKKAVKPWMCIPVQINPSCPSSTAAQSDVARNCARNTMLHTDYMLHSPAAALSAPSTVTCTCTCCRCCCCCITAGSHLATKVLGTCTTVRWPLACGYRVLVACKAIQE